MFCFLLLLFNIHIRFISLLINPRHRMSHHAPVSQVGGLSISEPTDKIVDLKDPLLVELLSIPGVFIAGGFVTLSEVSGLSAAMDSDVDIWVCHSNLTKMREVAVMVERVLLKHDPKACMHWLGSCVASFYLSNYSRPLQVIGLCVDSPWDVIKRFDIDACEGVYFMDHDTKEIHRGASQEALRAWKDRRIYRVQKSNGESNPFRIQKWINRGFRAVLPEGYKLPSAEKFMAYEKRNAACMAAVAGECSEKAGKGLLYLHAFSGKTKADFEAGFKNGLYYEEPDYNNLKH